MWRVGSLPFNVRTAEPHAGRCFAYSTTLLTKLTNMAFGGAGVRLRQGNKVQSQHTSRNELYLTRYYFVKQSDQSNYFLAEV